MRRPLLLIVILTVGLFVLMWGYGAFIAPYSAGSWWGMGPYMVRGPGPWGGYGPGMMYGYGPGSGWNTGWRDLNLSTDNVKAYMER
jgi:hypothetical protein